MNASSDSPITPHTLRSTVGLVDSYLISQYPTNLIDVRWIDGDHRLTLRPVMPQDNRLLADLINRMSERSLSRRFPNAQLPASADELASLVCIDYRRHLAMVVAVHEGGRERLVAEARYLIDPDGQSAEFMLMVDDAWQRQGIATWALHALGAAAHAAGVSWMRCDLMADNAAMLALMRHKRFCCTVDRGDGDIVHAETRSRALVARSSAPRPTLLARALRWLESVLVVDEPFSRSTTQR
ncbi:GNAT family N-acetyltransferase [Variovorax robiniae]|uniref:GNAT family N-acetyltransferase n=1 Tax=Variovorax robiniae TaxID=1836199 RepID=A0ABU8XHH7_9BURK